MTLSDLEGHFSYLKHFKIQFIGNTHISEDMRKDRQMRNQTLRGSYFRGS